MTATAIGHRPVSVLSIGYEDLGRISMQKAARLLALGKAVVQEADPSGRFLRHAGGSLWPVPVVIRLTRYFKIAYDKLYSIPMLSKRGVLVRDNRKCAYCLGHADTIDHIVPRSRGGADSWMNWISACQKCNNRKDNRTPEEARMPLLFEPHIPTRAELRGVAS
jgi:hypothetical protein